MRAPHFISLICLTLLLLAGVRAQSPNGTISGLVTDSSGAVIIGANALLENEATGVQYSARTNPDGLYLFPNLAPGIYRLQVSKIGFKTIIKPEIVVNVQSALGINFSLPVGAAAEIVTVVSGASVVNTESASVSTVIDRNFVENLPLNGRSFNTLLQLTPGVVIAPTNGVLATGQFAIAGQRSDANNFIVDGVSANFGVTPGLVAGQSGTGTAQAFSALGGTSSLVSVEDLQEFRVETSSFAPEFGRSPGGQVVLNTRSGTNRLHGAAYEYFRNDVLDANDWFANNAGEPRAAERHNDFGAVLGGPIRKDRTFFFASYEGARLHLPQSRVTQVPSIYARSQAPPALAPFLNAYPLPTGQPATPTAYTAPFTGSYSNAAALNAGSIRIDQSIGGRLSLFGRFNDAPSDVSDRVYGLSMIQRTDINTRTLTLGLDAVLSSRLMDTLRGNYSTQASTLSNSGSSFGGAVPLDPSFFLGASPSVQDLVAFETFDTSFLKYGPEGRNQTRQLDFADDLDWMAGTHEMKFGADYRSIFLNATPPGLETFFLAQSVQSVLSTGTGFLEVTSYNRASRLVSRSLSLYAQDTWKVSPRLTLTYGARWELSPAPAGRGATTLASWENPGDPAEFTLAPSGSPVWSTTYWNLAPRIGVSYSLDRASTFVLRAGWGIFYDLGMGQVGMLATTFPNSFAAPLATVSVPVQNLSPFLPTTTLGPPYPGAYGFSPDLALPRSYEWNVALEKSIGASQTVSITYVGQAGRKLLRDVGYFQPNSNFQSYFYLTGNNAHSNYDALELQYSRPLATRLQVLASYTWSHSLDNSSSDVVSGANTVISAAKDYASSDFDVRQSVSGALVFRVPGARSGLLGLATGGWSFDIVVVARSGFPFNGLIFVQSPVQGYAYIRPDVVPGQPFWVADPAAPGRKILNAAAFHVPPAGPQGTEGRNDIVGFPLAQADFSVARKFSLSERLALQFRADAFNVFNHPNFSNPQAIIPYGPLELQSTSMLNQGLGGLNPLFQEGGPRSLQLSLHLSF